MPAQPTPPLFDFDLLEQDGNDLPLHERTAARQVAGESQRQIIRFTEHLREDGPNRVLRHICSMGLDGMESLYAVRCRLRIPL
jgi:ATP-dependent DNA ligase